MDEIERLRAEVARSAAFHRAFRQAAEIQQRAEWPKAAQEAWATLYAAASDCNVGVKLLAELACLRDALNAAERESQLLREELAQRA